MRNDKEKPEILVGETDTVEFVSNENDIESVGCRSVLVSVLLLLLRVDWRC